jgi:hypothetical protein
MDIPVAGAEPDAGRARPKHGYAEPAEIAGRPLGEFMYWIALALAAGADLAAFNQIVSIAMPQLGAWLIWLVVAGFTAGALTLAHFAGRLVRDRAAGHGHGDGRTLLLLLVAPWAMLGVTAFVVRLIVANQSNSITAVGGLSDTNEQVASAGMFLVLYVVSGVVAGVGAYLTRNPCRTRYRMAARDYRKSLERLARSQAPYERALSVLQLHIRDRRRDEQSYLSAKSLRLACADELKRYAAVLIAAHLQDPSATDGMTLPDRIPLTPAGTPRPAGRPATLPPDSPHDPAA